MEQKIIYNPWTQKYYRGHNGCCYLLFGTFTPPWCQEHWQAFDPPVPLTKGYPNIEECNPNKT